MTAPRTAALPAGVIPPLCTPLTPDREVDVASLERLCRFLLDAGVHGLFVTGSTGEVAYLTDRDRRTVLSVVAGVAAGQVPVYAGVIDTSTPRVVEQARAAAAGGADAVVATAPFYAPTDPTEFGVHFRAIRSTVDVPLIAYDIPSAVHSKLPAALVAELADEGVLAGLKDSSGDLYGTRAVLDLVRGPGFTVYSGSEVVADLALLSGVDGLVPGLGNVDPHGYLRLYEAARRGDWTAAATEQRRLRALFAIVDAGAPHRMGRYSSAIGAFKEALAARGVIADATTSLPMIPLDPAERATIRAALLELAPQA
jgi:4-hydroxy-tetrahydrodipicolinate synthase